jgi:hypothetical protein
MNPSTTRTLTMALGVVSLLAAVLALLALHDISRGEADVRLEWSMVRISFLLSLAFHSWALWVVGKTRTGP